MDSFRFIDNIQVEKRNALARYKRLNNITKVFRLMEFLFVVALISWSTSYVPNGFKVVGGYIYACSCYILNQHVVFLLGNFIVILCYVLSGHATESVAEAVDSATDSIVKNVTESVVPQGFEDNYKTYETNETVTEVVPAQLPVVDNLLRMKETVVAEKTEGKIVENEEVVVKTESAEVVAIKQASRQIERFKRTQSARLKREMSMRPSRELRRSVTDRRRSGRDLDTDRRKSVDSLSNEEFRLSVIDRRTSSRDLDTNRRKSDGDSTVDSLSNEEFRLKVEDFILKQQSFLKEQAMVEQSY